MSRFGETYYGYGHLKLKIYPTVILQLTTLSLLISLSSSAVAVMPAMISPSIQLSENGATLVHNLEETQVKAKEVKSEDYMPITDSENVEKFINDYFADIPIMVSVAKCESQFRQYNSNGTILKGRKNTYDRGVMQINLLYHEDTAEKMGLDLHNIDDNVSYARYLYEKQGVKPWMSSSPCWSKFNNSEIAKR